jgi:hypothetical protein
MAQATGTTTLIRPSGGASAPPVAIFPPLQVAHIALMTKIAASKPHRIGPHPLPFDLYDRATHVEAVMTAFRAYLGEALYDVSGIGCSFNKKDRDNIEAVLEEVTSEVVSTLNAVADRLEVEHA